MLLYLPQDVHATVQVRETLRKSKMLLEVNDQLIAGGDLEDFLEERRDSMGEDKVYSVLIFEELRMKTIVTNFQGEPTLASVLYHNDEPIAIQPLFTSHVPQVSLIVAPLFSLVVHASFQPDIKEAVSPETWSKLMLLAKYPELASNMMAMIIATNRTAVAKDTPSEEHQRLIKSLAPSSSLVTFNDGFDRKTFVKTLLLLTEQCGVGIHPEYQYGVLAKDVFDESVPLVTIRIDRFFLSIQYDRDEDRTFYTVTRKDNPSSGRFGGLVTQAMDNTLPWASILLFDLVVAMSEKSVLDDLDKFLELTPRERTFCEYIGRHADIVSSLLVDIYRRQAGEEDSVSPLVN